MKIEALWSQIKDSIDNNNARLQYTENSKYYNIFAIDGPIILHAELDKSPSDTTDLDDFEDNYKSTGNQQVQPTDSSGIPLQKSRITKTGWHYQIHGVELETSKLASIYNKDEAGTDLGFTSIKFYNSSDTELVAGTQAELDSNCTKTVVDFEMDQDIEVIGGTMEQTSPPGSDVRLWITAIPDLTVVQGGSIPFTAGGINLRYISGPLDIDGKSPKLLPYDATYHTNKFRVTLKHAAGTNHPLVILFKLFRENV